MSAAERLRIVCAIQQTPGYAPGAIALAFATARELGTSLDDLTSIPDSDLARLLGWSSAEVRAFHAHLDVPIGRFQQFAAHGIRVSTRLDDVQPTWCNWLHSTPWYFYRGDLAILDQPAIGFSGSRDAGDEAIVVTRAVASEAVQQGMTVISGGARGVDMAAHVAALESSGTTLVLVPQGLDTWWAPVPLGQRAHADRLLVLSEDPPWAEWTTPSAMQRNRAIVDLSDIIVIPQAGTTGGSHSTGLYALSRKRDLWVADIGDAAPGNQVLLQRGAKPLPWSDGVVDIARMGTPRAAAPTQQSLF